MRRLPLLVAAAVTAQAVVVHAQSHSPCDGPRDSRVDRAGSAVLACGASPTDGVYVPTAPLAGTPEATAVTLNPSGLAFLPSWQMAYLHTELDPSGTRGGRGDGLYLASPVPLLSSLGIGVAVESIRPPATFPYRDEARLSYALAWRPATWLSVGARYSHVWTGDTPGASGIDTLDLAATLRAGSHLGLALVAHDVPAPQFQALALQRSYEAELAFRPLGSERWEVALGARLGERRLDLDPRLRVQVMAYPGLWLRGSIELVPDVSGARNGPSDLRATVGLELDLERFGLGGYALFGGDTGAGAFHGWAVTARLSGDRWPSLVEPRVLERIDLASMTDRQTVRLLAHLRALERRPRTDGILLVLGDVSGGWARMEELREAIFRLRAAGRHVYAYGTEVTAKAYYVGCAAEKLWLDPAGGIRLVGMSSTATYFKGTFDLAGVHADFIKIAEYKSAPEQWTRTGPSDEAKAVRSAILDDISGRFVHAIADARHKSDAAARKLVDQGPYTAVDAERNGLVDGLRTGDTVEPAISTLLGHEVTATPPDPHPRRSPTYSTPRIAVIHIDGDITDGRSMTIPLLDMKLVGQMTLLQAIVDARSDPRTRALVIRVDSPGGSALASDLIARELARTRAWMPVVCSFGDTAASGGYFVATGCDPIFALPSTVTGSIGIFSGKFDVSGLAAKLGVSFTTDKRGAHADIESYWRPYTDEERTLLLGKLRYYYDRFLGAVAENRHVKPEAVDAVGRGHVWTGAQASRLKEVHLVDQLGGFIDAVDEAKRRAGLGPDEPAELASYPEENETLLGQLASLLGIDLPSTRAGADPLGIDRALLAPLLPLVRAIPGSVWVAPSTPQARLDPEVGTFE